MRRHNGAVLADPVGSGKTYVALAVAATVNRGPTACLVPATLVAQWQAAAAQVDVRVTLCSHEQISRGRLPTGTRGLVIIDESHHFRNPHTRRYKHLARWLVGRAALLVTATPIVNRVADLGHQLVLAVRDNALMVDGIVSLRALLTAGCSTPALGQLVIESEVVTHDRPARIQNISRPNALECGVAESFVDRLSRLRLSRCKPIAGLIRGVLLRAAGSSPAALAGALRRYQRLLLHARDALAAGRALDRDKLRRFSVELGDQLIWWELLPVPEAETEIELGDLPVLEDLIRATESLVDGEDGKLDRLRQLLGDGTPTLVFSTSRDTVRYIRDRLRDLRVAWCTGDHAGIGTANLPRPAVLGWFRKPVTSSLAPLHLVVTDVAAEGLDLQRAARVVHYDLPWTPMRLEQREGRSVRYGSRYSHIEVVRFPPPSVLERSLRLEATLVRKANLPATVGLGSGSRHLWRWRIELAERFSLDETRAGVAAVTCPHHGLLAGFALHRAADPVCLSASVLWLEPHGAWTEAPDIVAARLTSAAGQRHTLPVGDGKLKDWLTLLAIPIRERLALTRSRRWVTPDPAPAARRLAARLQRMVRDAARRHHADRLAQLERALAFAAGGHTAGEAALVEQLADSSDHELAARVGKLPPVRSEWDGIEVRLTGLVIFGPAAESSALATEDTRAELASLPCDCKPPSSTSTEP